MIAIIAILNVNLNQGSLNAYVFFCQLITINLPSVGYPAWFVSIQYLFYRFLDFALLPFSIWNLEFINFPSCSLVSDSSCDSRFPICLSRSLTPLGAISLWYVIALYPLLLLALLYSCVIMYGKGWRCVVCIVRPIHRLLAHFWRSVNIQPSLTHTLASVYTLCFTQLAATSLKILQPSWYYSSPNHFNVVFFYDGSQSYFRGWHGFAGAVAVLVLLTLIVLTSYLLVYPFQALQWCFGKIKVKKDLLISVTDVFTSPYKNGTENTFDYRYFAGAHFALLLILMTILCLPFKSARVVANVTICALYVSIVILIRPYKRNLHNCTEALAIIVLAVTCIPQFYLEKVRNFSEYIYITFLGIIFVMVVLYCLLWMVKKCRQCFKQQINYVSLQSLGNDSTDGVRNDRHFNQHNVGFTRPPSVQLSNEINDNDKITYSTFK